MPAGLQVFDEKGKVLFDSTMSTTRIIGSVDTGTSSGSITVPEFAEGQGWAVISKINTDVSGFGDLSLGNYPLIQIDGTALSWSFGSFDIDDYYYWYLGFKKYNLDVQVIYGVYL